MRSDLSSAARGATEDVPSPLWPLRGASRGQALLFPIRSLADLLALVGALGIASWLRFSLRFLEVTETTSTSKVAHISTAVLWAAIVLTVFAVNRLYDEDTLFPGGGELAQVFRSCVESIALVFVLVFFTHTLTISRSWLLLVASCSWILLTGERMIMRRVIRKARSRGLFRRPVLLVTDGSTAEGEVLTAAGDLEIRGAIPVETARSGVSGDPSPEERKALGRNKSLVIQASDFTEDALHRFVVDAGRYGLDVILRSNVQSVGRDRLTLRDYLGETVVKIAPPSFRGARAFQKRAFDLVVGTIALILATPLMLGIALAVLLTSGGPILFRQPRAGKDGVVFTMLKFRTMRKDAEEGIGQSWASEADPRRTPLGAFLRRWSLDETPQLFNVLRGHMSLVGPRPEMSTLAVQFGGVMPDYDYRHRIKPGLTGIAQAKGLRGNTSLVERIQLDNWYVEHWSMALDIKVIIQTLREIAFPENAY